MQRGSVFCQACIMHSGFGRCLACLQQSEGEPTNIALSNPTKQIEMIGNWNRSAGSFVCFKSFRDKVFSCVSQALIEGSLARIEKHRRVAPGHRQCSSSQVEVNCWQTQVIFVLLGLRWKHPCEACLWKADFADSSKVKVGFRESTWTEMP